MRRLNDTIVRLSALRAAQQGGAGIAGEDRLTDFPGFGSNPGALRARIYVPDVLNRSAALVVVLHGCTQNAAGYDRGSGWSRLADEQGFVVLYPEQQRSNNANLCFNWFNADDTRRGSGEALSIRQMVAAAISRYELDPMRVFITGLSAGGAMASVMLATYPELFGGGAIIAGLPYGTARTVPEAFDRMRAHGGPAAAALGPLVRAASDHGGPWPTLSVWHGGSDATVHCSNAMLIVEQWRALHGAAEQPSVTENVAGHRRQVWRNAEGRDVIESYHIAGLGHGTPLSTSGAEACGVAGPYMLEAGISSTRRIAAFWGLAGSEVDGAGPYRAVAVEAQGAPSHGLTVVEDEPTFRRTGARPAQPVAKSGVGTIIEDALRAAGLMR